MLRRVLLLPLLAACASHATPVTPPPSAAPAAPATAAHAADPPAARPAPPAIGFRLPTGTRPLAYRVTLTIDPGKDSMGGDEEIDLERSAGPVLYLRGHELTDVSASLRAGDSKTEVALTATATDGETLAMQPLDASATLPAGRATLHIRWTARVRHDDTQGVFAQKTDDAWYAYSNFEPQGARRVFPCFDEPSYKVPWQLSIVSPKGTTAVSNSPAVSQADEGSSTRVVFAPTPPLPSYLVAFAVGPFELVGAGKTKSGAPIRVAVPRGHAEEATIPVEDTAALLDLLEDYFGSPYPFAKLDLVPIPDTIGFGAMENPGMITYNAGLLLTKPAERTGWDRRGYASVAAHEMAHQWFGDLVTMAWWDDLWLNEGFASWMEDVIVASFKPEWKSDISALQSKNGVMGSDSRESARKIRQPVENENDAHDAFDGITYQKGAAIIGMVESWLGRETFQKGIRLYLSQHARGNATYADLVAALREVSGRDVAKVMDDFVDRTGVPFVTFNLVCAPKQKPYLELDQRRFVPFASTLDKNRTWHIPISVRWQAGKHEGRATTLLAEASGRVELDAPTCPDWVMPNENGAGYYQWQVTGAAGDRLRAARTFRTLPARERLDVAQSVRALVSAGELPYRRGVEMAMTLIDDPEQRVRQGALRVGGGWADDLPKALLPRYRAWVRKTFGPAARKVGWVAKPGETDDDKSIRQQLLWRMIDDGEDAAMQKEANRQAWKWLDDRTALAPEMADTVLSMAAHGGDAKLYERFLAEARKANQKNDKPERVRFLGLLGGFRDPALVERTRAMALEDEFPTLETSRFLYAGTDTHAGRQRAWDFMIAHYDTIVARLPRERRAGLITLGGDCTTESLERAKAFFAERTPKELSGPRTYKSFVEGQTLCIARRQLDLASFIEFLTGR